MTSPQLMPQERAPLAELVPIGERDIFDVARFIALQSGRGREAIEAHLRWFWLQNPAREPQQPLGFGLRSLGELVGCILCIPQIFQYQNQRIPMMGSSSFYVDERYRGHGGRIFLQYSRLANSWPLFGTSANAAAAALWKAAGANPIAYSSGELFGILHWPAIAEELAHRRTSNRLVSRAARSPISRVVSLLRPLQIDHSAADALQSLTCAEQVNDVLSPQPAENGPEKITALRDPAWIRWRYFSGNDATVGAFAYRDRFSGRNVFVAVNQRLRGYRSQIRTLNVLDVSPELMAKEWLPLLGALIARYSKLVDAVVLRNQNPESCRALSERGFHWRAFDAPNCWLLDRRKLLPSHDWYMTPADGDGLI